MAAKTVLVVDDSATMRELIKMALKKIDIIAPVTLVEGSDGQDGLKRFQEKNIDLVLTDIKMPNMTGLELIEGIRKIPSSVPIIVISTKGEKSDIERGLSLGANEYLLKPISVINLKAAISKLV